MLQYRIYRAVVFTLFILTVVSCKKEKEYAPYPYNQIQTFTINAGAENMISAAFDDDSILVYWPSYLEMPEKIKPTITVSENATVSPASGAEVDFTDGLKYTVTAQNGATKDYFLKVIINQPAIQLFEQTYAASKGITFSINNGTTIRYLIRDTTQTSFYLLDGDNKETKIPIAFETRNGTPYMDINLPEDDNLKIGAYKMKIISGQQSIVSENAIFGIVYSYDNMPMADELTAAATLKRGGTITFTGTGFIDMQEARAFVYDAGWNETDLGTLELVSFTATSATYKIPDNFPLGSYVLNSYDGDGVFLQLRTSDYIGFWTWNKVNKVYVNINGSAQLTVTD